jgi:hypothetical protein
MNFYVTGGRQRSRIFTAEEEWRWFERALIICLDTEARNAKICVDYESPPEACPSDQASICFKSGTIEGDRLYACTSTEVLVYEVPGFRLLGYISLPSFNDLHHVRPTPEGNLIVASTGLDMVIEFTLEGRVLREWNVLGEDPWERFSKEIDYRKVPTTKPYRAHPNFVFWIGKDIWVTRGDLKDAVSLTNPGAHINIGMYLHDGISFGDKLYFTSVDGKLVIVDKQKLQITDTIDLTKIDNDDGLPLGWCRGVLISEKSKAWIGFSRLRPTKFKEKILWATRGFKELQKPTHITLYDFEAKKRLQEIDLEQYGMNSVFSILPTSLS